MRRRPKCSITRSVQSNHVIWRWKNCFRIKCLIDGSCRLVLWFLPRIARFEPIVLVALYILNMQYFFSNIKQRLAMAVLQALNNMQYLWKSASKELKLKVLRTCIFPIGTYGCETWVLRKLDIKRINAFEMKCYRKVLRIPWIAHRTNCSILNELHLPTNWMYNFVRRQKLKYFGHVTRHNGLEKTIMQGMVAGKRSREKKPRKAKTEMGERHHGYVRYDDSGKQSGRGPETILQWHLGSDVLTRICSEKKNTFLLQDLGITEWNVMHKCSMVVKFNCTVSHLDTITTMGLMLVMLLYVWWQSLSGFEQQITATNFSSQIKFIYRSMCSVRVTSFIYICSKQQKCACFFLITVIS